MERGAKHSYFAREYEGKEGWREKEVDKRGGGSKEFDLR